MRQRGKTARCESCWGASPATRRKRQNARLEGVRSCERCTRPLPADARANKRVCDACKGTDPATSSERTSVRRLLADVPVELLSVPSEPTFELRVEERPGGRLVAVGRISWTMERPVAELREHSYRLIGENWRKASDPRAAADLEIRKLPWWKN